MPGTHVALLRGLNLGGKTLLPMKAREEVVGSAAAAWSEDRYAGGAFALYACVAAIMAAMRWNETGLNGTEQKEKA